MLFLVLFQSPNVALAVLPDSAGVDVNMNDRILIHGANGYIRKVSHVSVGEDGAYRLVAHHPAWYGVGPLGDSVGISGYLPVSATLPFYKSITDSEDGPRIGEEVTFRTREFIDGKMRITRTLKKGRVTEIFSGGHFMIKTGWYSEEAISRLQLFQEGDSLDIDPSELRQDIPTELVPPSEDEPRKGRFTLKAGEVAVSSGDGHTRPLRGVELMEHMEEWVPGASPVAFQVGPEAGESLKSFYAERWGQRPFWVDVCREHIESYRSQHGLSIITEKEWYKMSDSEISDLSKQYDETEILEMQLTVKTQRIKDIEELQAATERLLRK